MSTWAFRVVSERDSHALATDGQQQPDAHAVGLLLAIQTRLLAPALDVEASHLGDA